MLRDLFDWAFMDPSEKSLKREVIELGLLFIVLVAVLYAHERAALRSFGGALMLFMIGGLVVLISTLWANFRELLRVAFVAGIIVFGLIRPYVVQAFYIPSRSMENTLLVNDHIFVNKFWYRVTGPERWEIIVFEYPNDPNKDYIKRLVGTPGDTVAIREGRLRINGRTIDRRYVDSEVELRLRGRLLASSMGQNPRTLRFQGDGLSLNRDTAFGRAQNPVQADLNVSNIYREASNHRIKLMAENGERAVHDFRTNFGPIRIPREGETIDLSEQSALEKRYYLNLMDQWFDQNVSLRNGVFYLGGMPREELKIRQKLYFAMGDNRDHSEDSRVWGFVPEERLLGQAFFVYWPPSRIGLIGPSE
jgi:signal peptidase I